LPAYVTALAGKNRFFIDRRQHRRLPCGSVRHGIFVENVPMLWLLMAFAESGGTASLWIHCAVD